MPQPRQPRRCERGGNGCTGGSHRVEAMSVPGNRGTHTGHAAYRRGPRGKTWFLATSAAVVLFFCSGCGLYSERRLYHVARLGLLRLPDFPPDATVAPLEEAEFFIGKSAGCVRLHYSYTGPDGKRKEQPCVVWLDRICIRWEVNRCERLPTHEDSRQGEPASMTRDGL